MITYSEFVAAFSGVTLKENATENLVIDGPPV
jgi:hypothetical protein